MRDVKNQEKILHPEDIATRLAKISGNVINRTFMVSPKDTNKRGANAWIDNSRAIRNKIERFRESCKNGDVVGAVFDRNYLEGLGIEPENEADLEYVYKLSELNEAVIYLHECSRGEDLAVLGSTVSRCMLAFMESSKRNYDLNKEGFFKVFDSVFDNEKIVALYIKSKMISKLNGLEGEAYALNYLMEKMGESRPGKIIIPAREDDLDNKVDLIRQFDGVVEYYQIKAILSDEPVGICVKNDGSIDDDYDKRMNQLRSIIIQMGSSVTSINRFIEMVNQKPRRNNRYDGYVFFSPIREDKYHKRKSLKQL